MESARLATVDDAPAIEAIAERQRERMEGERGASIFLQREAGLDPLRDRLDRALAGSTGTALVGCYDDVVFGYGLITWEELADGRQVGRITDLVVDAEARGSGIGEAMMDLIVETAEARGCAGIDAMALPGDRETKNFFESFGLKARLLVVHRSLGGSTGDDG
jgi:ribosomal protein S18 acetylase RimI-like enzyme